MTAALSSAPGAGHAPAVRTDTPADDPSRAPGVGGPSLMAARPEPADLDPRRALRELARWRGAGQDAASFPYRAVLGHYRTVGKNAVGDELLTALRAIRPQGGVGPARLLADWLPQVVDGRHGDYAGYAGIPVYTSLAENGASTDHVITALLADIVETETATLAGAPAGPGPGRRCVPSSRQRDSRPGTGRRARPARPTRTPPWCARAPRRPGRRGRGSRPTCCGPWS
ncbi:hypothetical protein ABZ734_01840 [Streptomyces sp. NPDC006660]|uniref:hypothetical protein n=1 Tax=Streptomyces sp. NPDC006660 TaxID=3156901 RepID=UPI0033E4FE67